jgi:hypothetical protein
MTSELSINDCKYISPEGYYRRKLIAISLRVSRTEKGKVFKKSGSSEVCI